MDGWREGRESTEGGAEMSPALIMRDNRILKLNFTFDTINEKTNKKNNRKCRFIFYK